MGDCYIKADEIKKEIEDIGGEYVKRIAMHIEPDGPEDDPRDE
jgi:hypothetical protein